MASNRDKRREEVSFRVMQILHKNPEASTRDIARNLGISNGSAYYCLLELIDKGFVKFKNFTRSTSKSQYIYQLTPKGLTSKTALTIKFLERKRQEYNDLKKEIARMEVELQISETKRSLKKIKTSG